jgi:hypothetical protein
MDDEIGRELYDVVDGFFARPKGWTFVEVADVGIDAEDSVYVFSRGPHAVMIFDKSGHFLDAWGAIGGIGDRYFTFPHGLSIGRDGFVYTTDTRDQTVRKFTKDGELVMTLGTPTRTLPPSAASRSTALRTPPSHRTATST